MMPVDFDHPLVGRAVVYRAWHPGAEPEQGIVTSVNAAAIIVFVCYGNGSTSQATTADDRLTTLDGEAVEI
jgi:hypothetical protein